MADEVTDGRPETIDGALGSLSEKGFEFGECFFDGIEVWAIGRQEHQPGAGIFDQRPGRGTFMAGQIVHDDDVAGVEGRNKDLLDISFEPGAVDRSVQNHGRHHAAQTQPCDKRRRFAMPVREPHAQPLAFCTSSVGARHVRRRPGFINEDQPLRIEIELVFEPAVAALQYVWTILLYGVASLFLRVWL